MFGPPPSNRFYLQLYMVDTSNSSAASLRDVERHRSNERAHAAYKSSRAARIVWREHEKRIVAAEMGQLMRRDPRCRPLRAVLQAQQVLPASRRRAIQSWAQLRPQLEAYLHESNDPQPALDLLDPAAAHTAVLPGPQSLVQDDTCVPAAVQTEPRAAESVETTAARVIGKPLRARIDAALTGLLGRALEAGAKAALAQLDGSMPAADAASPEQYEAVSQVEPQLASAGPRKLQVLVAGLFPLRRAELVEELSHAVELTFWHTDLPRGRLADMISKADVAIAMTDFADTQTIAQMTASSPQYVAHPGGVERLKARILALAQAEPRPV